MFFYVVARFSTSFFLFPSGNNTHCIAACAVLSHFSQVQFFVTLRTAAHQLPLSMGLSRQEYWSWLPCCPPGNLPTQGLCLCLLNCRQIIYHWAPGEADVELLCNIYLFTHQLIVSWVVFSLLSFFFFFITHKVAIKIFVHILLCTYVCFPCPLFPGYILRNVEASGNSMFNLWGTARLFSKEDESF